MQIPKRSYLATLNGAKEPDNQMVIVLDPINQSEGQISTHSAGRLELVDNVDEGMTLYRILFALQVLVPDFTRSLAQHLL